MFTKKIVGSLNNAAKTWSNTLLTVGDINGDGKPDIAVSGRAGQMAWFQNPGDRSGNWKMSPVADVDIIECGGSVYDITGNGLGDLIIGSGGGADTLYWFENLGNGSWKQHVIIKSGRSQFHDTMIAQTARDTKPVLYFTNQGDGTSVHRVEFPSNPFISPWPGIETITEGKYIPNPDNPWGKLGIQPEEGLTVGDVDNDGELELVCGTSWYKFKNNMWESHRFAPDYITTKVKVADINGDGKNEIILTEGDACCYGKKASRMAWFSPGDDIHAMWNEHVLFTDLIDPHSLHVADLAGNGHMDILVGELGKLVKGTDDWDIREPELFMLENDGKANFKKVVIDKGTGIHDAFLIDMDGDGKLDIVGRPLMGNEKWNIHVYYRD